MLIDTYASLLQEPPPEALATWPYLPRAHLSIGLGSNLTPDAENWLRAQNVFARTSGRRVEGNGRAILLAPGLFYESPFHQFVLAEFLASHGFTVASAALTGARSVLVRLTAEDLEAEVRDLECVRAYLRSQRPRLARPLGVFGWDLGGMAALSFSARSSDVGAVICFDSGVTFPGLVRRFLDGDFSELRASVLVATRPRQELESQGLAEDLSLLQRLDWVDRTLLRVPRMRHADFSSHAMIEAISPGFWGPARGTPHIEYARLVETATLFFEQHLAVRGDAQTSLGAISAVMGAEVLPARTPPPAFDQLARASLSGVRVDALLVGIAASGGHVEVSSIERLAEELLYRRDRLEEAEAVLRFGLTRFPTSTALRSLKTELDRRSQTR